MDTFLPTCSMFFTGYLSSTRSYFVSLPWSGGAFWALLRPTSKIFAISHWAPEVVVPSAQWNGGGYYLSLLPVLQLARLMHSRWLATLLGMDFHWYCDCSPGFTLMHSTLALKLIFLAMLESGALLSSSLEEALYKST